MSKKNLKTFYKKMNFPQYFATSNVNKLKEFNQILNLELKQIDIDLLEPQSLDLVEIAEIKSRDAYNKTQKIVLIEDTSLEFLAWEKLPGTLIKWFLKSLSNQDLINMLSSFNNKKAVAKTIVSFFDGNQSYYFIGELEGSISQTPKGDNGFGWDSIFIPNGSIKTFAEMDLNEKNLFSMRKIALEKMKDAI